VAGLMHELFNLIRENRDTLGHEFFLSVLRSLHPKSRLARQALVNVANGAEPTDKLGKMLVQLRNNVLFHYGPKAIFRGYDHHFLGPTKRDERAYVSRGDNMRATRFYFADAAATGYARHLLGSADVETLSRDMAEIIEKVNYGLMMIVLAFIQRRGCAFRREAEP
jgi:hypothetical protein